MTKQPTAVAVALTTPAKDHKGASRVRQRERERERGRERRGEMQQTETWSCRLMDTKASLSNKVSSWLAAPLTPVLPHSPVLPLSLPQRRRRRASPDPLVHRSPNQATSCHHRTPEAFQVTLAFEELSANFDSIEDRMHRAE